MEVVRPEDASSLELDIEDIAEDQRRVDGARSVGGDHRDGLLLRHESVDRRGELLRYFGAVFADTIRYVVVRCVTNDEKAHR